ncbi:MarR family winged helix-turn-helix transcriptional regulator [Paeniglutamicibacter gangotriensis]|uniref:MarR family transcriptional regulator n=2 Tax=Paeniglutamicibacter gangotriensis TaxID=254787 RepID=M7MXI5_9MICC|nr:MarR family transcriptional regulator [Paeniglutamicibacter gangotriensis]EMQ99680.1 MarR family transcriptional regulator [Paeniglutamicibacter gangotriensis Lz1y]KAA0978012.1 MarR family transcriptional regulator [Paeniglutamicibacter gangotriensis]
MGLTPEDVSAVHPASKLLSEVLVQNGVLERALCRYLNTNETDLQALQHLIRAHNLTPSGLAARLQISTAATTAVIDRMSERGHVERNPHPSDRRSQLISASPAAVQQVLAALRPLFNDAERVIGGFGRHEQAAVVRYLEATLEAMNSLIDDFLQSPDTTNRSPRS